LPLPTAATEVPDAVVEPVFDTVAVLVVVLVAVIVGGILLVVTPREDAGEAAALSSEPEPKAALAV
jgi:hypothetical protein